MSTEIEIIDKTGTGGFKFGDVPAGCPFKYSDELCVKTDQEKMSVVLNSGEMLMLEADEIVFPVRVKLYVTKVLGEL